MPVFLLFPYSRCCPAVAPYTAMPTRSSGRRADAALPSCSPAALQSNAALGRDWVHGFEGVRLGCMKQFRRGVETSHAFSQSEGGS